MTFDEAWDLIEYGLVALAAVIFIIEMVHRLWIRVKAKRRPAQTDDRPLMSRGRPAL